MPSRALAILLFLSASCLADVYKWVDGGGMVHYSDRPPEAVQAVQVSAIGASGPADDASEPSPSQARQSSTPGVEGTYTLFEIVQPEANQTFRIDTGEVSVGMLLEPGLQQDHQIQLSVDGVALKDNLTSTQLALRNLGRGSHTLSAVVVDAAGKVLATAIPVAFHLRPPPSDLPQP